MFPHSLPALLTLLLLNPFRTAALSSRDTNLTISTTGSCGSGLTCLNSQWGNCCSSNSFCGGNYTYCGAGCQSDFGACYTNYTHISPASDGTCGSSSTNKYTCLGSIFGNCCSESGFCGANSTYCGTGCQGGYGACGVSNAAGVSIATMVVGAAATATGTASASASASASAVSSSSSSGLSTGAKAGIGVGVALGAIIALGGVAFFVVRRRKNSTTAGGTMAELPVSAVAASAGTKHDEKRDRKDLPNEMEAVGALRGNLAELPASQGHSELHGKSITEQDMIARVDDRAAAGYDGAYRGN